MTARRIIRALRVEAVLAAIAYAGLLVFAHPTGTAALVDLPEYPWANRLFYAGLAVAMAALGCLALRLWGRLAAGGRRRPEPGECRAVAGTVMVEFALVFPLVLLVMCMIVQLALIANASLVVRYAAFASARSAMVNLQSWPVVNAPPLPEPVVRDNPELAARLVLASISPRTGQANAAGRSMESLLRAQDGVWAGRSFADRFDYTEQATVVTAGSSYSQLVPVREHLIPPAGDAYNLPLITAADVFDKLNSLIQPVCRDLEIGQICVGGFLAPDVDVCFQIDIGPSFQGIQLFSIPLQQCVSLPNPAYDPFENLLQNGLGWLSSSSPTALYAFADLRYQLGPITLGNVDYLAPKQVSVTVAYDFLLTVPSLHFIPGLNLKDSPTGSGTKVFPITHTVRLQSTGGRQASFVNFFPVQGNTLLWW
ncbi:MAG: TadE family protein [Planctomycetota bacterium]